MSNPYFRFKQFTVFHDQCAMKVGTDGVLLGAWANCSHARNVLDVGTGSGLIALMVAQRSKSLITGIDIDADACKQASINAQNSPFSGRLRIIRSSFQDFYPENKFDLIVSNPPFFANALKSPDKGRSQARHSDDLPLEYLFRKSVEILSPEGKLALIIPADRSEEADVYASESKLHKTGEIRISPLPGRPPKRILLEYSMQHSACLRSEWSIELSRHVYSDQYITLTKDFYLKD